MSGDISALLRSLRFFAFTFNVLNPLKICWVTDIIAACVLLEGRKQRRYPDKEFLRVKMLTSLSTTARSEIFIITQHSAMAIKPHAFSNPLFGMGAEVSLFRR